MSKITAKGRKAVNHIHVGHNIKTVREAKDISRTQLARAVNADERDLFRIEYDIEKPSLEILEKITAALKVTPNDLLSGKLEVVTCTVCGKKLTQLPKLPILHDPCIECCRVRVSEGFSLREVLGKRITSARKHRNLSQAELAEKVGITQKQLSQWEKDKRPAVYGVRGKLAEVLDVNIEYLLGLTDYIF